jgi:hypothetical protein
MQEQINNIMLILITDTLNNTNSIHELSAIKQINQIGILDKTIENFENGVSANDFDNLGFLLQLWTKLLIHLKNEQFTQARMEKVVNNSFDLVISKKQILKNINQFKPNDDVEAMKNLVEEYVDISNVHRPFLEIISSKVVDLMITLEEMNQRVIDVISKSRTRKEMYENMKEFSTNKLQGGWFDIVYLESQEVKCNSLFSNQSQTDNNKIECEGTEHQYDEDQELTELENRILVEEFFHYEKMKSDFIVFVAKFFDNSKSNIYQNIIEKYEAKAQKDFFDFLFISLTHYNYSLDFFKLKKYLAFFIKILLDSSNKQILDKFVDYFKKNIHQLAQKAEDIKTEMTERGNQSKPP